MKDTNEKIEAAAESAKIKAEKVIDDIAEVVGLAAAKAGQHMHAAGEKVKDAGERMMKLVE